MIIDMHIQIDLINKNICGQVSSIVIVNLDDFVFLSPNKVLLSILGVTLYNFVFSYFEKAKKNCISGTSLFDL